MRFLSFSLLTLMSLALLSCGTRNDGAKTDVDTTKFALATEDQDYDTPTDRTQECDFNGKHYVVNIKTAPADSLPKVKDQYDKPYKDNLVMVKVTENGATVIDRTFSKPNFETYLEGDENKILIMGGMAFREVTNAGVVFEAFFNKPLDEEGGVAFKVVLPHGGGTSIVTRDNSFNDDEEMGQD